jgi:YfiH family protein
MMLHRKTSPAGVVFYASPALESAGVPHAFSTRLGGVSTAPFDSLNLGNPSGCAAPDADDHIEQNYRRLQDACGLAGRDRCSVHQVHGPTAVVVGGGAGWDRKTQADAMVTSDPSRMLSVRVADCVPILLASAEGDRVAAVHAGWRGVIAGVIPATVARMDRPADLLAAIGPCIGPGAFEVGPEVVEEFRRAFGPDAPVGKTARGTPGIDLRRAVQLQLLRAGLRDGRIDTTDRCTVGDRDEFYSHRRDQGLTGRMAAVVGTRPR